MDDAVTAKRVNRLEAMTLAARAMHALPPLFYAEVTPLAEVDEVLSAVRMDLEKTDAGLPINRRGPLDVR